jgi:large subunit ribosomal protein L33
MAARPVNGAPVRKGGSRRPAGAFATAAPEPPALRFHGNSASSDAVLHRDFPNSLDYGALSLDFTPSPGPPLRPGISSDSIMAKPVTQKIKLVSTAGTGYYYVTKKNPRNLTEKLALKKYDPVVKQHVEFKESKIK